MIEEKDADISMSSESLAHVLKVKWGTDTLQVNGRFRAAPAGKNKFFRAFRLGGLNNAGISFNVTYFLTAAKSELRSRF